jgi:hypothetical protein
VRDAHLASRGSSGRERRADQQDEIVDQTLVEREMIEHEPIPQDSEDDVDDELEVGIADLAMGGTSGIGRTAAAQLAGDGADVIVTGRDAIKIE